MKEVILLAGGLGTRLRSVVADRPKPLSLIAGRPFIEWQIEAMSAKGIERIVLAVGYLGEMIETHLGNRFAGCNLSYSYETSALGTGGAIRLAMKAVSDKYVFVSNGDTFIDCNFPALEASLKKNPELIASIAVIHAADADRYAFVSWDEKTAIVTKFLNKGEALSGWINAGLYCINRDKFIDMTADSNFSIEKDFFEVQVGNSLIAAVPSDSEFIDIGIPSDYNKAQLLIPKLSKKYS